MNVSILQCPFSFIFLHLGRHGTVPNRIRQSTRRGHTADATDRSSTIDGIVGAIDCFQWQ